MAQSLELGLDTFGDVTAGSGGRPLPHAQVIRNVIGEAVLADQLGIDFFGVGEHHRADFAPPTRRGRNPEPHPTRHESCMTSQSVIDTNPPHTATIRSSKEANPRCRA